MPWMSRLSDIWWRARGWPPAPPPRPPSPPQPPVMLAIPATINQAMIIARLLQAGADLLRRLPDDFECSNAQRASEQEDNSDDLLTRIGGATAAGYDVVPLTDYDLGMATGVVLDLAEYTRCVSIGLYRSTLRDMRVLRGAAAVQGWRAQWNGSMLAWCGDEPDLNRAVTVRPDWPPCNQN